MRNSLLLPSGPADRAPDIRQTAGFNPALRGLGPEP